MFEKRVLPVTEDIMFKWRLLVEEGRKVGHTFSQPDLIIAATALCHGLTIVSRDTSDYERASGRRSVAVMFRIYLYNAQTCENPRARNSLPAAYPVSSNNSRRAASAGTSDPPVSPM